MTNPAPPAVPSGFVPHCGTCGRASHMCDCKATLQTQPGYGGPLVQAGAPSPFMPQGAQAPPVLPPPSRFIKFGDSMICTACNLDARYCKGHAAPVDTGSNDGDASDLIRRVRECTGGR